MSASDDEFDGVNADVVGGGVHFDDDGNFDDEGASDDDNGERDEYSNLVDPAVTRLHKQSSALYEKRVRRKPGFCLMCRRSIVHPVSAAVTAESDLYKCASDAVQWGVAAVDDIIEWCGRG